MIHLMEAVSIKLPSLVGVILVSVSGTCFTHTKIFIESPFLILNGFKFRADPDT
jgi:hypothetical protein